MQDMEELYSPANPHVLNVVTAEAEIATRAGRQKKLTSKLGKNREACANQNSRK